MIRYFIELTFPLTGETTFAFTSVRSPHILVNIPMLLVWPRACACLTRSHPQGQSSPMDDQEGRKPTAGAKVYHN